MEYRILGVLSARDRAGAVALGGHRQQLVLAVLLDHANQPLTTDQLTDAVWGAAPPATARKTLQVYVSRLRQVLGSTTIESRGDGYLLRVDDEERDVTRFLRLADEGRRALTTDPGAAAATLRSALALWHGSPWGPLGDELALQPSAQQLRERRLEALEDRIEADLARGELHGLSGELGSLLATHPLRERLYRLAMLTLYRQGRQAEALELFRQLRTQLATDLGIDPSPELQQLHERILRQDGALAGPTPELPRTAPSDVRNPYRGLQPFTEADADDFFGREGLVDELVARLDHERFVVLVGPSGSGKSSIVRAGLVPAVRRRGQETGLPGPLIATMVPGAHPFESLEAALLRCRPGSVSSLREQRRGDDLDLLRAVLRVRPAEDTPLLLLIDQFEELFLLVKDRAERSRFARNLVEAVEDPVARLTVVLTLRADLFDHPLAEPGFGELVVAGLVSVPPLTPPQLETACVRPAARVGVTVEPELAAELVVDVAERPGALPLFEYALTELFEARTGGTLTLEAYRGIGGLRGALARRADETFEGLGAEERLAARQLFLRLVTIGEGVEDARRRVRRAELDELPLAAAAVGTVLDRFGQARLLAFDRDPVHGAPTVEVAHEALLRAWPRLRSWIDGSRDDLRLHGDLAAEAAVWERADRDPDYLLAGSRLALYETWSEGTTVALTGTECRFLETSRQRRDRAEEEERQRQRHELDLERRARMRLRSLALVLAVAVLVSAGLTTYAVRQTAVAEGARDDALVAAQMFRARELAAAAVANRQADPELSLLLAMHAVTIAEAAGQPVAPETVEALHWGLQAARVAYPVGAAGAASVLDGPRGPQGIYLLGLRDLLDLARQHVDRQLTAEECDLYLGPGVCPALPATFPPEIDWSQPRPRGVVPGAPAFEGTTVRVFGAGADEIALGPELEALRDRTGITVTIDQEDGFEDLLEVRAVAGEVDLAIVPEPGLVAQLAAAGELVELSAYLDVDALRDAYSPHLIALGSVADDGTWPASETPVYGLPHRLDVKSIVWYPVGRFEAAGYEVPATWEDLVALTDRLVADGRVPWCHGERSGSASGWPGTDWIEDLLLGEDGPDVYDAWVSNAIPFDDPQVRRAFLRFDELVLGEGRLYGGRRNAVLMPFEMTPQPMFDDPPGCWLTHTATFAPSNFFPDDVEIGRDVDWFRLPAVATAGEGSLLGSGEYLVAFTDRPEVRQTVRELVGTDWGRALVGNGAWFFPANRRFPLDAYSDDRARAVAALLQASLAEGSFRYDGSDLMPREVFTVFWENMVEFAGEGPGNLDALLTELDGAWTQVERGPRPDG
jgi:DNA-binding SARP family transcriptional activator/ABC-type glycerol-3-phosphate transport system substrate-binding protein